MCSSQGVTQHSDPHERVATLPNLNTDLWKKTFETSTMRPQSRVEMANSIHKHKAKDKTTFHSLSEVRCLPVPSSTKPEETDFVVDSGASMHMLTRKHLNSTDLDSVRVSGNPTTANTANGQVQTNEEATGTFTILIFSRQCKSSRIRPLSYRLDNPPKIKDILMSGSMVRNHTFQ